MDLWDYTVFSKSENISEMIIDTVSIKLFSTKIFQAVSLKYQLTHCLGQHFVLV